MPDVSSPDVNKEDAAVCASEINDVHREINQQQLETDKQILTLSSGLIVLSLAFAKDIASTKPVLLNLLISGLAIIALCIVGVLFSFWYSIRGLEKVKLYWEQRREDTYGKHIFPANHANWIKVTNTATYILFAVGFVCIAVFVIVNVRREVDMAKQNTGNPKVESISPKRNDTAGSTVKVNPPPPPPPKK